MVTLSTRDGHLENPIGSSKPRERRLRLLYRWLSRRRSRRVETGHPASSHQFLRRQRPEHSQQIHKTLDVLGAAVGREVLQLALDLLDDGRVEQLAQLRAAEQLGEQGRVEAQRGRATFGQRRVALVHERSDISEQQGSGERRRRLGLDLDQADRTAGDLRGQGGQRGQVVDVLQNLAHGLEDDREARVLARDLEQLRRALPLLPERRTPPGVVARQQQGPCGGLAEARREQR